jgi:surfeit locus 1 family protein
MTASVTRFRYTFTPSFRMMILSLLGMIIFTLLGFWQLHRAAEKKYIISAQQQAHRQLPTHWSYHASLPQQHARIIVEGHFLKQLFFLDNQHEQHQFGYHVISPFMLTNQHIILVDRGWVQGELTRTSLPIIETPNQHIELQGSAYYPSSKQWTLGQVFENKEPGIAIMERLDTKLTSQFLHKSVYPFIIRLDKDAPHGYQRVWRIINMPPERHLAYAFQWFAMSLVVLILFITLNLKKK